LARRQAGGIDLLDRTANWQEVSREGRGPALELVDPHWGAPQSSNEELEEPPKTSAGIGQVP
jgi:hypothetical protein